MPALDELSVPAEVPTLAGSDDPSTAPALTTPAEGDLSVLFDNPDFEGGAACVFGTVCRFYELTVTVAGTYTVTMDWNVGGDIDMSLCPAPGAIGGSCDFQAATGAHPEVGEFTLAPGTYFVVADDFNADAIGTTLVLTVEHGPPAAPFVSLRKSAPSDLRKVQRMFR